METRDETDGTPEWAKRMFRRLRAARWRFVVYMFFVILPAFGAFRLLQAAVRGEVWRERSDKWIGYSAEPGKFLTEIAVWLIAVIAPILFVIFRARYPDRMQRLQDTIRSHYKLDPASRSKYRSDARAVEVEPIDRGTHLRAPPGRC